MKKNLRSTKFIVIMGLFIGMSIVGGYIKLPNPVTSSIAMDSFPAFAASLILGGIPGAIIGFLAHMMSAAIGGFPMTLPIHLLIGTQMAIIMFLFKLIFDKFGLIAAGITGIILNGILAPACFILIPGYGVAVFTELVLPLMIASIVNIVAAIIVYSAVRNKTVVKTFLED